MFCRVASAVAEYQDTIEYKVYNFLEKIFDHKYNDEDWDPNTHKL